MKLVEGDSLDVMKTFADGQFSAACFSPPYDVYGPGGGGFDIRRDFGSGGRFVPYALEVSRVARVWAINLSQRVVNGSLCLFQEQLAAEMLRAGVHLFDRWVLVKKGVNGRRGQRAYTQFEFVHLYAREPAAVRIRGKVGTTVLTASRNHASGASTSLLSYDPVIPRQVFEMYGEGEVLDPFAGTGTSLIEAHKLGLQATGVELDPAIAALTRLRIANWSAG